MDWLIRLLGGVPKDRYRSLEISYSVVKENLAKAQKENRDICIKFSHEREELKAQIEALEEELTFDKDYAMVSFPEGGEYNFSINSKCPNSIMVEKGAELTITGYKGDEKLDKIVVE